ncbi:cytochrome P450 [Actinopolymorpha sp. B11F2]|uniref:cytochrome P450 family protein n=1 Tax=Actinopolymorpha sp. B11F2 TaxID=3160862 RepID=UPI0032E3A518
MPGTTRPAPLALDPSFFTDPYAVYAALRHEGPVRRVMLPNGWDVWVVTRYAEARAALADPRLRKDPRVLTEQFDDDAMRDDEIVAASLRAHMLNADPPDHTRLRKLVTKAFTARRIDGLRPRIEAITDQLLDDLAARVGDGPVDLLDTFAFPLPITVICDLLGVPPADRDDFRAWSTTIVSDGTDEEVQVASYAMASYLDRLLADKRADPGDDLLTALIHARDDEDRLDEHELVSMAFLLLVAGHETTVNLIGNGTLALLRHPDQLAHLQRDPSLLPGAVEELLRYDGPVNLATMRFTAEPVVLGTDSGTRDGDGATGVEIPAGEFVLVSLASADHDGSRFADPDRLDVTRPAGGHLAFGHGIHYCLGAPLARLEGEIAFTRLLGRFPGLRLAGAPAELRWRNSSLIRGLERLPVHLA